MEADSIFARAASALSVGGQETLYKPPVFECSGLTHEPFRMLDLPAGQDCEKRLLLWGVVTTSGAQFDGDRTDVHDVLSLIWGGVLRAFGLGSVRLIDEPHGFVPGEIGARYVIFEQCPWNISDDTFEAARKSMNAWTAFAFHLLSDVFQWDQGRLQNRPDLTVVHKTEEPVWVVPVTRYLRNPKDVTISKRTFPVWMYFASHDRGVTIIRMPKNRLALLRGALSPYSPEMVKGEKSLAILANGIPNAIPFALTKKAHKLFSLTADGCENVVVMPLDSHCLFIGDKTIVAIRGECGRVVYERERKNLLERRSGENSVFFADSIIDWKTPMSPGDFEDLCVDLVRREPGVLQAKPVGTVNDRDSGRDILIDRKVPAPHSTGAKDSTSKGGAAVCFKGTRVLRFIAQVKSRQRTIGKSDVQDIRDTLERHQADGFLLIAHPRISSSLVDHLDGMRRKKVFQAEWWEARDLEDRLRRHPDIAKRYPRLMSLHALS